MSKLTSAAGAALRRLHASFAYLAFAVACLGLFGCSGGHSMRTVAMRSALDAGTFDRALAALNKELKVASGAELPKRVAGDDALLVLDRAAIQQAQTHFASSKRDYEVADKAIDILDLSSNATDSIARWLFSDSAGRYVAPPHEKILVNTFNMLNYLETADLEGAKVEARRMVVASRYLRDREGTNDRSLALGSLFAGFAYEKSGESEEALRFYRDAGRIDPTLLSDGLARNASLGEGEGEVLIVIGEGRVPHRVAKHEPIGLALTRAAPYLSAGDKRRAEDLALQGLVTWVNYPTLAASRPPRGPVRATVDGRRIELVTALDCESAVRAAWSKIEPEVMAAAVTRSIARVIAGKAIEETSKVSKKESVRAVGAILSLFAQLALTVADVPDTRSWETIPARVSVARVVVPAGSYTIGLAGGAMHRDVRVRIRPGGYAVASLLALR